MGVQTADTDTSAKQLLTLSIALCSCGTSGFSWGVGVRLETVGSLRQCDLRAHSCTILLSALGRFFMCAFS